MTESQLSPSPFLPLSQMVGTYPSRTPHPRWWAQARAAVWGRACFCPHMIHSLLQALPCPVLPQAGPSACWPQAPVLSRVFSLKPCPAKCEILPTLPSSPEGFQRLLVGATVARHLLSPSWSWDGYEGGTLLCLTSPGQAYPGCGRPGCAQPCCGRLAAVKSRYPDLIVSRLVLGL